MEEHKNETRYFSCERCNLSGTGTHNCPYLKANERTYTQKELYQFVTDYSREARDEGFDMSVGDFVDWVASREESSRVNIIDCDRGAWACANCGFFNSHSPNCTKPLRAYLRKSTTPVEEDKPVLPRKLGIHSSKDMSNPDDVLDTLLEMQDAINSIVECLKASDTPEPYIVVDDWMEVSRL